MRIFTSRRHAVAAALALLVASSAGAKDVLVHREGTGRTLIAADAQAPDRLVISGHVEQCESHKAVHVSSDRGKSWTPACLPTTSSYWVYETPSVAIDGEGTIWAAAAMRSDFDSGALFVIHSTDNGQTWSDWKYVAAPASTHGGLTDARIQIDDHAGSPYRGSIYISHTVWEEEGAKPRVVFSRDGGQNWAQYSAVLHAEQMLLSAPSLAIGANGKLNLVYAQCLWECPAASVNFASSTDGGVTWKTPVEVANVEMPSGGDWSWGQLPGTDVDLAFEPSLAIDTSRGPRRGELYLAMSSAKNNRLSVVTMRSEDGGKRWTAPQAVSPVAADQFMPSVSVNEQGEMAALWLDRRNDPEGIRYQPMLAFSADGGRTFGEAKALDKDLSDPRLHDADLSATASHTWAGQGVQAAFIGTGQQPRLTVRSSRAKP